MAYDWRAEANKEGTQTEKLPDGTWQVEIVKVIHGKKDGPKFESKGGDRQIMVVFADANEREIGCMYTLSGKAGWALAKLLDAASLNLDKMSAAGITPERFADEEFANKNLIGRKLVIEVKTEKPGDKYPRINPVKEQPTGQPVGAGAGANSKGFDPTGDLKEDEIPF